MLLLVALLAVPLSDTALFAARGLRSEAGCEPLTFATPARLVEWCEGQGLSLRRIVTDAVPDYAPLSCWRDLPAAVADAVRLRFRLWTAESAALVTVGESASRLLLIDGTLWAPPSRRCA